MATGIGLAAIVLVGIGANFPNPGQFTQVNFAAGPSSGAPGQPKILILGNRTTAGAATVDTVVYGPDTQVPVQTEADVITQFGAGSQLHRAWKRFNAVNKTAPIYFVAVKESTGAAATGVVKVATTATSAGNIRFWCGQDFVDTSVNTGDTATTIGGNIASSINAQVNWPITATNTSGTIAITAKNKGPEGNWIKIQVLAGPTNAPGATTVTDYGTVWAASTAYSTGAFVQPSTANGYYYEASSGGTSGSSPPSWPTTIGQTVTDSGVTWTCWGTLTSVGIASLGGGATADSNTNALSTILPTQFRYIISCDSDATNVGALVTQATTQAQPATGIYQQVFFGSVDTLANATTVATGLNSPQAELQWAYATDWTPLEIAANNCAIYSLFENSGNTGARYVGRLNFSLFPTANAQFNDAAYWFVQGTRNGPSYGPTTVQITSALNNGLSPIALLQSGQAQLVKRITTRSLNGSTADYRIRDAHRVSIMFAWAQAATITTQQQFGGKDLLNVPAQGAPPLPSYATDTQLWGNALKDLTTQMGNAGLLQNTVATNAAAVIQRETSPSNRMSAQFDLQTADIADQFCTVANQVH